MIKPGDRIPAIKVHQVTANGVTSGSADTFLGGGRVVFFTLPGAYTPTCHNNHLPGFIANAANIRAAGIKRIVCGTVNDHHVVSAWGAALGAFPAIEFIADGNGELAPAMGLQRDMRAGGMAMRFVRSALLIRDGLVEAVFAETGPGLVTVSGAPAILMALEAVPA